jgi:hypothetical protein
MHQPLARCAMQSELQQILLLLILLMIHCQFTTDDPNNIGAHRGFALRTFPLARSMVDISFRVVTGTSRE